MEYIKKSYTSFLTKERHNSFISKHVFCIFRGSPYQNLPRFEVHQ